MPKAHLPEQEAVVRPDAAPNVPAAQFEQADAAEREYIPAGHKPLQAALGNFKVAP